MQQVKNQDVQLSKLMELIGDTRFGVLTTVGEDGELWNRPISTWQIDSEGELWFFAKLDSPVVRELRRSRRVSVCYSRSIDCSYVSIAGSCQLIFDPEKAEELWDDSYQHWLPGGPGDPSLVLVRVVVERAEYWQGRASRGPGGHCRGLAVQAGFDGLPGDQGDAPRSCPPVDWQNEDGPMIVTNDPCPACSTDIVRCFHKNFACTLGLGATPYTAAEDLLRRLTCQRDQVADHWHRNELEKAIADIEAFLGQSHLKGSCR